jgi:hypothetical protein
MTGLEITLFTVRLALLLAFSSLCARMVAPRRPWCGAAWPWLWAAGCALFLAHVAAAFHFFHGWSHAHAYAETARQTEAWFGWHFGGGLYANYLFTVLWTLDAATWCFAPGLARRIPRSLRTLWLSFFLFMAFQGAVVFAEGPTRVLSAAGFGILGLLAVDEWRRGEPGQRGRQATFCGSE